MGTPEELDPGRMIWTLELSTLGLYVFGLWTTGSLASTRLDTWITN